MISASEWFSIQIQITCAYVDGLADKLPHVFDRLAFDAVAAVTGVLAPTTITTMTATIATTEDTARCIVKPPDIHDSNGATGATSSGHGALTAADAAACDFLRPGSLTFERG